LNKASARVAFCLSELFNPQLYAAPNPTLRLSQEEIGRLSGLSRQNTTEPLASLLMRGSDCHARDKCFVGEPANLPLKSNPEVHASCPDSPIQFLHVYLIKAAADPVEIDAVVSPAQRPEAV
jgi:hypothetical protein